MVSSLLYFLFDTVSPLPPLKNSLPLLLETENTSVKERSTEDDRAIEQGRAPLTYPDVIDNRLYHDTHSCPLSLLPSSLFHV